MHLLLLLLLLPAAIVVAAPVADAAVCRLPFAVCRSYVFVVRVVIFVKVHLFYSILFLVFNPNVMSIYFFCFIYFISFIFLRV